jgi:hypothetical protein
VPCGACSRMQLRYCEFTRDDMRVAQQSNLLGGGAYVAGADGQVVHTGSRLHDALRGGVLYVNVQRASNLLRKPFGKLRCLGMAA